jgi:hypothetical protein
MAFQPLFNALLHRQERNFFEAHYWILRKEFFHDEQIITTLLFMQSELNI